MDFCKASFAVVVGIALLGAPAWSMGPALAAPPAASEPGAAPEAPALEPSAALETYQRLAAAQAEHLAALQDQTIIHAELPGTSQSGDYELVRTYTAAPRSLHYVSVKFTGDGFVKSNVIVRVLQSEVEQVERGDRAATAITERNYKFSFEGPDALAGHTVYVFEVKPRRRAAGLFKGRIFLDAHTGSLRRIEGSMAKTPSFFIRRIDFTQDFEDIDGFTVPTELHSTTRARVIGRAMLSIVHRGYHLTPAPTPQSAFFTPMFLTQ